MFITKMVFLLSLSCLKEKKEEIVIGRKMFVGRK